MHVRELLELAVLAATHGRTFIRWAGPVSPSSQQQYWTASKCRLQRWTQALREHELLTAADPSTARRAWEVILPVLEEILLSEILTRVWGMIASAHDTHHGRMEAAPIARSVLVGHTEARHRALNLMLRGNSSSMREAVTLNQIRRKAERWNDVLLAFVLPEGDPSDFAFDPRRCRDFADDCDLQQPNSPGFEILLASLRNAFRHVAHGPSPNADLNEQIAGGVLACFSPDMFDSTGVLHSRWLWWRLNNTAADTQGMLSEILYLEGDAEPPMPEGVEDRTSHGRLRF